MRYLAMKPLDLEKIKNDHKKWLELFKGKLLKKLKEASFFYYKKEGDKLIKYKIKGIK